MLGLDKDRVHTGPKSSFSETVTVAYSSPHSDQSNKSQRSHRCSSFQKGGHGRSEKASWKKARRGS